MAKFDAAALSRPNIKSSGAAAVQAQQAIGGMSADDAKKMGPRDTAQLGAQVTKAEGAEVAQNLAGAQDKQKKRGQISINKTATQQRSKMAERRNASRRTSMDARQRIASMGKDLDKKLFEDRRQFEYDARGIRFKNVRQLADYKKMVAKDDEEYANFAQEMQQRSSEKRKVLEIAQAKITQALTQASKAREGTAAFNQKKKLLQAQAALNKKIAAEAATAKNNAMIWQGVGTVAGAVVGAYAGNPVLGAQIGATAGAAGAQATS